MTIQLPERERVEDGQRERRLPDVLFEEARRRRRRRWMAGGALVAAAIIAGALVVDVGGGGGGGAGVTAHSHPSGSGSGASSTHVTDARLFPGAPAMQSYFTGPGAVCTLAPPNRYLPGWSGCASATVGDVYGDGQRDLVLTYSRLSHSSLGNSTVPSPKTGRAKKLYPAEAAMLGIVTPGHHVVTIAIKYRFPAVNKLPAQTETAQVTTLISVAHLGNLPGKQVLLSTGHISSGTTALAYSVYQGRLISSGAVLGYGGDSASKAGFRCLAGDPPRIVQNSYELIRGDRVVHGTIYGVWNETATTYAWHGPLLVKVAASSLKQNLLPNDRVGFECKTGIL